MSDPGARVELAAVMPVYNEEGCIAAVVAEWQQVFRGLGLHYRLILLDDGSRDRTPAILDALSASPELCVIHKPNSGHGPTILKGYALAVTQADWVFQCDSDNEMEPARFPAFWQARDAADAIFGIRTGRQSGWDRRLISAGSRLIVRWIYGRGVQDVNVPYRLMRAPILAAVLSHVPETAFAPNVIIAGAIARRGWRIVNLPVPHRHRRTGRVSIMSWRLWRAALLAAGQTIRCRPPPASGSGGRT